MTDPAPDGLLDRVRKLLNQAEDPSVTEHEADAFNRKAAELIARYGIDQALLAARGAVRDDITRRTVPIENPYSVDKAGLLGAVATAMRAKAVHHTTGRTTHKVVVFGFASDLERTELIYTSLLLQATQRLTRLRPDYDPWATGQSLAAYRRSWFAGFTYAVSKRLQAAEAAQVQASDAATGTDGGPSTALVLRDRDDRVAEVMRAEYPRLGTARPRQLTGWGYHDGRAAGSEADLGTTRIDGRRDALGR